MKSQYSFSLFLVATFWSASVLAQSVPQGMNYQAVARSLDGNSVADATLELHIDLYQLTPEKSVVYTELHSVATDAFGLFNVTVGNGEDARGEFSAIPWSSSDVFMEVEIRLPGQSDRTLISDTRLLSVPYAFHARTASRLTNQEELRGGPSGGSTGNVWKVGGNTLNVPGPHYLGTIEEVDLDMITSNLVRLTIQANGDVSIENSLDVGVDLTVGNDATINNDLEVGNNVNLNTNGTGATVNFGDFTVANTSSTDLSGTLNVDGESDLNNNLRVNNTSSTDLSGTLNVDGESDLNNNLRVNNASSTDLSGTLNVDGESDLNNNLRVNNGSSSDLSGSLNVSGATTLQSSLDVNGTSDLNGQLTVTASTSGSSSNFNAYPLRVQGANQGVAIKVNGNRNNDKNFITFMDAAGVQGRIEGQTTSELQSSFPYIWSNTMEALSTVFQTAIVIADIAGVDDFDAAAVGGLELVQQIAQWLELNITATNEIGIAYESGSGDYAEWLKKMNPEEIFSPGDIVGVFGGEISKSTEGAHHYMVISKSPIVLGNMPPNGQEPAYEKVAFMGQVPVKLRGEVRKGDYILCSHLNDGIGRAVSPENMKLSDFNQIVGVAWSASLAKEGFSIVNVAVGINSNDMSAQVADLQQELHSVKGELNNIIRYLTASDPDFNIALFDSAVETDTEQEESQQETSPALNFSEKVETIKMTFEESGEEIDTILSETRALLDSKGIDYRKVEQTHRLVTDKDYLMQNLIQLQAQR
jgi:hypothetical protein